MLHSSPMEISPAKVALGATKQFVPICGALPLTGIM
jgi:hypothetical protein